VAENQPVNKHRMNKELSSFAARLHGLIEGCQFLPIRPTYNEFESLSLELFALQFQHNPAYQKICLSRKLTPDNVRHWMQIPAVPTSAFKELELTSIPLDERTTVFHSSGTTGQTPSRHFHCAESLALYEASLWQHFELHRGSKGPLLFLTPPLHLAQHSSLVYMFETLRKKFDQPESTFVGGVAPDGSWNINFESTIEQLKVASQGQADFTILGTAFSFVHLLDYLIEKDLSFRFPFRSVAIETGGYKNRSRALPKDELHRLIQERLGLLVFCEYGMSELGSQAYDTAVGEDENLKLTNHFQFPPWAQVQIVSPETGKPVRDKEIGLIRIIDLANVFSVGAIQTEDLGRRWWDWFDLIGRAQSAGPRGCSLMTA
jgi:hypothetical protein